MIEIINKNFKRPIVILINGTSDLEYNLIQSIVKYTDRRLEYWEHYPHLESLNSGDVLIVNKVKKEELVEFSKWSFEIIAVGRFEESQIKFLNELGVVSLWNLKEEKLEEILGFILINISNPFNSNLLIWTRDSLYSNKLKKIFSRFSLTAKIINEPEHGFLEIEKGTYSLMVLDWDNSGLDTHKFVLGLKKISAGNIQLPRILGIKDYNKPNLFQDLSAGIKEYCNILFTKMEILELLFRSLPILPKSNVLKINPKDEPELYIDNKTNEKIQIKIDYEGHQKEAIYIDEIQLRKKIFLKQFNWLKIYNLI